MIFFKLGMWFSLQFHSKFGVIQVKDNGAVNVLKLIEFFSVNMPACASLSWATQPLLCLEYLLL